MRSDSTDAESKLWWLLRNRKLGGFKFRRQVPLGNYILDFYCPEAKLAVEADGGQHDEPINQNYDERRATFLQSLGIRMVRFWDNDILKHAIAVREQIYRELMRENIDQTNFPPASPHPNPLPEGEGEIGAPLRGGTIA